MKVQNRFLDWYTTTCSMQSQWIVKCSTNCSPFTAIPISLSFAGFEKILYQVMLLHIRSKFNMLNLHSNYFCLCQSMFLNLFLWSPNVLAIHIIITTLKLLYFTCNEFEEELGFYLHWPAMASCSQHWTLLTSMKSKMARLQPAKKSVKTNVWKFMEDWKYTEIYCTIKHFYLVTWHEMNQPSIVPHHHWYLEQSFLKCAAGLPV